MPHIEVNGVPLFIDQIGKGPAVVLLHGFASEGRSLRSLVWELDRHFTTISVDLVGHSRSGSPLALDHYELAQIAFDLVEVLRTSGFQRAAWFGHGLGGRIALEVALRYPDAVAALVLEGTQPGVRDPGERAARRVEREALADYPADQRWREFCHRIGLAHIADDPRFADRFGREGNANVLREYYETAFAKYTSAELSEILEEFGALNAVYNDFPTLLSHPQILANDLVLEFDHPTAGPTKTVGFPTVMTATPKQLRTPPPLLGQHTAEVLRNVGVSAEELTTLRGRGVV